MLADDDLLEAYVERGDQAAFREIVDRYGGLVLGIAQRTTADRETAREVAQDAFTLLARRAGALRGRPVSGWLHRTTVYLSRNAKRAGMRRDHYQRRYAAEVPARGVDPATESEWENALPLLDTLIGSLPQTEREILVEHFLLQRSFDTIAAARSTSGEAVRKRASRALDRLSRRLRSRGVTLSAAAAGVGLAARTATAVPPGFADSVAAHAIHAAPAVTAGSLFTHSLATMALAKTTIAAAVLAFAAPAGIEWLGSTSDRPTPEGARENSPTVRAAETLDPRLAEIAAIVRESGSLQDDPEQWLAAAARAGDLPQELLPDALTLAGTGSGDGVSLLRESIFERMAEFDPAAAAKRAGDDYRAWRGVLKQWMLSDPDAALAAIAARFPDGLPREATTFTALKLLAMDSPAEALSRVGALPGNRESAQMTLLMIQAQSDPAGALAWVNANHPEETRHHERRKFFDTLSLDRPDVVLKAIADEPEPGVRNPVRLFAVQQLSWANPDAAVDALRSLPTEEIAGDEGFQFAMNAAQGLAASDPGALCALARESDAGRFRDGLIYSLAGSQWAGDHPAEMADLAVKLEDPSTRAVALGRIVRTWLQQDRPAAIDWLSASDTLSPAEKETLLTP